MSARNPIPLFVTGLMAFLFVVLVALVYSASSRAARFDRDGVETTAILVSVRTQRTQSQPEKPPRYRHYATVRFAVNGQVITSEAQVTLDFLRAHEPGAEVQVRYLRGAPETVLVDPLFESRGMALAWMFLMFFAGCLIWPLIRRWRARRVPAGEVPDQVRDERAQVARRRPKAGPLPRWVRVVSVLLMLCALGSFFTLSIWLRYAVEAWALPHLGWVSLPLGMAAMLLPPAGFGLLTLGLIWGVQRFGRAAG
ncbi:DUF3592 domain-containing protein [Mameliella sp. CS4]|uniref:DUF3592 domain-containing protein n=1 Tax=Mameliella sp. CS4 TaxID=2862329 RepID=UPI001C5E9059|nr:DUF3592 domain-containing protein [Mameliella sp. CS4]MBW4981031.1 DUF3592 domain-containing protein [Mameliella sp. CS4]